MRNKLLVLGRFAQDSQSVLAAVNWLALVCLELHLNGEFIYLIFLDISQSSTSPNLCQNREN
jgi:hypothetical protein